VKTKNFYDLFDYDSDAIDLKIIGDFCYTDVIGISDIFLTGGDVRIAALEGEYERSILHPKRP
jgi:hypothetical protein